MVGSVAVGAFDLLADCRSGRRMVAGAQRLIRRDDEVQSNESMGIGIDRLRCIWSGNGSFVFSPIGSSTWVVQFSVTGFSCCRLAVGVGSARCGNWSTCDTQAESTTLDGQRNCPRDCIGLRLVPG